MFNKIFDNKLLFLINFFDLLGLGLAYPWLAFAKDYLNKSDIKKSWINYNDKNGEIQIYLHTLFCETKCLYCNCVSYVEKNNSIFYSYKKKILNEIDFYSSLINKDINTIYFGGGTFTLWELNDMEDIIIYLKSKFKFARNYKWMVEIHPNSITKDKLKLLKKYGITDLMIGIQTTSKRLNKLNNRVYNIDKINNLIDNIIELNFNKVYFDLMYGLPYEKYSEFIDDMNFLVNLGERLKKNNFVSNLELNNFNISYNVNYFSKINIKYNSLSEFIKGFLEKNQKMALVANKYKKLYFEKLFQSRRDEIVVRKRKNSAILGIGTGAISHIPGFSHYYNEVNKVNDWKKENKIKGFKLNNLDNDYSLFFNDIRYGINIIDFKKLISRNKILSEIVKYNKLLFNIDKGRIFLDIKSDYEMHLFVLKIYSKIDKMNLYSELIGKWSDLGYTDKELEENIDLYLKLYY